MPPPLPWRCLYSRGGPSAYGAVSALRRAFSRSPLSRARPRPHKRRRQEERSRAVSPSSKKHASPPKPSGKQGVFRSHPRGGSQLSSFSSPPSPSPAMAVGDMHGAVSPPRTSCTTEEKERGLLRYFSRGRCLYDTVPLHSASFALQRASCTQAQRVPLVTLFPAPSPSESAASLSTSAAACPTAESPGLIGVQPSASCPVGKSVTTAERPAPVAPPTASSPLSRDLSSNCFSSYELQERQHSDWLQFRLLSARFSSASDSNKFFGAAEMPLRDVCADMAEIWDTTCTTWEDAMRAWSGTACSGAAGFSRRHSACFLVCYVQTQQKVAVGMSVQRIAAQVCELARTNYAPQLFRVVPIFIGVRAQVMLCTDTTARSSLAADVAPTTVDARTTERVTYATGGLYTLAETVQCITRLDPHALDPRGSSDALPHVGSSRAAPELLCTLEPQVFLLSDSWLHVRSVADLYGDDSLSNSASDSRAASAAAPPGSEQGQNRHARRATSFVPESTRRNVHVVPAVVADRLSRIEERAIARYIWCNMQRRVSDRRTAETLQPLRPSSLAKPL